MKLKLNTKLKDEKGQPIGEKISCLVIGKDDNFQKKPDGSLLVVHRDNEGVKSTLKTVILTSLLFETPQKPLTHMQKDDHWRLWKVINEANNTIDLPMSDTLLIKDCIQDCQPIIIGGQCADLLEKS